LLAERRATIMTFTSTSTFTNFAALFPPEELRALSARTAIAVIGPATARAFEASGLRVDIMPAVSTIEGMVDAIADYVYTTTTNTDQNR
jgi:uroporphyrinogen III methyltransferase/synthase